MSKSIFLVYMLLATAFVAVSADDQIHNFVDDWLQFAYRTPEAGEDVRLRVVMNLPTETEEPTETANLKLFETATTICFRTQDDSYTLETGAKGFGIQFLCAISECTMSHHLHTIMFGSEAKGNSPATWNGSGTDVSHTNRGASDHTVKPGTNPDTLYGMTQDEFDSSNLPGESETAYFKCYYQNKGTYQNTDLNLDVQLETTNAVVDDWTEMNVAWNEAQVSP